MYRPWVPLQRLLLLQRVYAAGRTRLPVLLLRPGVLLLLLLLQLQALPLVRVQVGVQVLLQVL